MLRECLLVFGFLLVLLPSACRRDSSAIREEFAGAIKSDDGAAYLPIIVPERRSDSILGPISAAEQLPSSDKPSGEGLVIHDSTPEAVGQTVVKIAASNDWKRLPDLLVTEQADSMKEMTDVLAFTAAVGEVRKAAAEEFNGHAIVINMDQAWLQHLTDMADELSFEIVNADGDQARVVFTTGPPDAANARKIEWTARNTDDGWRLMLPDFERPSDPYAVTGSLEDKPQAFRDLAARIRERGVVDAAAADLQVEKVMDGTYEASSETGEASGRQAENDRPAEQPVAREPAGPPRRQRDAVDEVYTGPGMLRNR